ncbi:MAG: TRAM domain-containing protein, partial [Solirubrobacterales bacterium]
MESVRIRHRAGEQLELEIDSLAQGGRGVARADGYVVFVSGGLPGDRVRARLTKAKRDYAEATTVELVEPAPGRIADTCLHEGLPCPGAPWQGLPYESQLAHKAEQVDEALRRLGRLEGFELEPIEPAVEGWRYRNKLEYSFGARPEGPALGFHRRGSWAEIVDVDDCKLASEANNEARNAVRDWARAERVSAYESGPQRGILRNLVVREGRRTGQLQTRLVTSAAEIPRPPVDLHTLIEGPAGGTDGPTGVGGGGAPPPGRSGVRGSGAPAAPRPTHTNKAARRCGSGGAARGR